MDKRVKAMAILALISPGWYRRPHAGRVQTIRTFRLLSSRCVRRGVEARTKDRWNAVLRYSPLRARKSLRRTTWWMFMANGRAVLRVRGRGPPGSEILHPDRMPDIRLVRVDWATEHEPAPYGQRAPTAGQTRMHARP